MATCGQLYLVMTSETDEEIKSTLTGLVSTITNLANEIGEDEITHDLMSFRKDITYNRLSDELLACCVALHQI